MITVGSLFSGIGGFELGLERTNGFRTEWQVELDPYCQRVLAKHWPNVRRWDDVRTFPPDGEWGVDLICGGFPCQPVSTAGKRKGTEDSRWLWPEFARILRVIRPRYAILENTPGLFTLGFGAVLGDLATLGYDAEWSVLSACAMGAPHTRERVFIVAYANGEHGDRPEIFRRTKHQTTSPKPNGGFSDWVGRRFIDGQGIRRDRRIPDSRVCRITDVIPPGVDRIRVLGNSIVPTVAQYIGEMILQSQEANP